MKLHNSAKRLSGFFSTLILSAVFSLPASQANAALTSCNPLSSDPCFYSYQNNSHNQKQMSRPSRSKKSRPSVRKHYKRHSKLSYRIAGAHVKTHCFPQKLLNLMGRVERHYGKKLIVTSGYRSSRYNRRVGGAKRSQHMHCKAVDFRIKGVNKYSLARYVKTLRGIGGVGSYCGSRAIHIDIGPKRSWHWGCGKHKKRALFAKHKRRGKRKARRSYRTASYKHNRRAKRSRSAKKWTYDFRG